MKKLLIAMALTALSLGVARSASVLNPGVPAIVNLEAIVRAMPFQQVGGKTNQSKNSTNITRMYKSTIARTTFGNAELLTLLANSFNTNFPAGSGIGMNLQGIVILDGTGTNVLFTPSSVVSFQIDEEFAPETETIVTREKASGTEVSGNLSQTIMASVSMNYDDALNSTADGTHTKFAFKGLLTLKITENLKTRILRAAYQFNGTGGGPVRDVATILTGNINGQGAGAVPAF